ncbi:restriction endonuclease subunit S [Campylobacter coli]|uniref:restriction endonuclease subunit S n=1 Tax=Campylobacter coli TaxID=195 RepID=UPI000716E902|nr:restriction endonuclease subunit S [Campylobacter coli]EAI4186564.1 restriction endonuclease subunit S [Campylobacter coli]EAJ8099445.1 restriction endonuclease subunit S [Campylobacter coli]EGC9957904.1 restriction endonuclease subunit S [Campylobacter coli]EHV6716946.1 restriction endonuclease subunit S [Campylobacter coli]KRS52465.1 type I restriction modification protein [Campylobacter coli]
MTNLPQGWKWKSLGEICFITDGTHKTPNYIETGIPFLSVKNISKGFFDLSDVKYISLEEHNKLIKRAKPEFGDILICRIGTLGKAIKISLEFEFSIFVSLGLLKPKVKIISDYLVYFLNSCFIEEWINDNKVGGGTHTAKLNLNILEKCPIALPPLKEQERIVGILDENFAKIDENIKILEQDLLNLDELMQSALQKAFNPLKDNAKENYKLPQGWEWKSLGEIANTSSGGTPSRNKKEYWENGNIKWLKSGELNDGYIDFIEENITEEAIKNSSAKIFQKGTLLIAMYGATAGKLGILNLDSTTNQAICAFLHKDKNIKFLEKFLFYFLFFLRDKIIKDSFGGAQPNINQTYIKNLQIPLPPIKEQEQITSHLDELSSHVKNLKQNYQAQIKDLQELKNSLLDKAFKGNL